jgi:hypothetical protein
VTGVFKLAPKRPILRVRSAGRCPLSLKYTIDTFLTKLPEMTVPDVSKSASVGESLAAPRGAGIVMVPMNVPEALTVSGGLPQANSVDMVMSELLAGPRRIREFMPLFGNSLGLTVDAMGKLEGLGYVSRQNGDSYVLTTDGREVAVPLAAGSVREG